MNKQDSSSPLLNRLRKNLKQLKPYLEQHKISCYRVFDWDMPEFPLCIDFYEGKIHVSEYKTRHSLDDTQYEMWLSSCIDDIVQFFSIGPENLFLKERERHKGVTQYEKVDERKHFFQVKENGLKFSVNLSDYLDTGLFLDHRVMRKRVMEEAKGKHVLNLFAYTGSFSVYACAGGAFTTTTVDLSNTYLNWARENFKLNGFSVAKHQFIKADAKEWVKQPPTKLYDIVVLDPPTMSRSKMAKSKFDVQEDHPELINHVLKHIVPGGILYFSTNFRNFILQESLLQAERIEDITLESIPKDFRNKKIHYCWKLTK
jgi:23S rRNA (cytosine1962-C5)-methyltransferase